MMYDRFECKECENTSVTRPKSQKDRDAPMCTCCSEAVGGVAEMAWVSEVAEEDLEIN